MISNSQPFHSSRRPRRSSRRGISEAPPPVTSGIFRLRQRYAILLREEIRNTVRDESEVEEEIRHLLGAMTR